MPPSSSTSTGTHLTTSRIHRILRPLKTKSAGLASIAASAGGKPTGGVRITYGSRNRTSRTNSSSFSTSNPDEQPPLAILPPPEQTHHAKSTSQYDSTGNLLALSKNVYGIRDAFRNVINTAFGGGSDEPHTRSSASSTVSVDQASLNSKGRVVSLAGLCAIVVGEELGAGHEGDRKDGGGSTNNEERGNEEEEATRWVDEIYEEIPFHVRRWTVVSHALQIILQLCPPCPTLLYLLLEVCITHPHSSNMIPLAETLLRSLITISFTSPSNPSAISPLPPPICHAAHPTFLTDLHSLWCNSDFRDGDTFISVLLGISVYGTSEAWTSKAVTSLAKDLSKDNFNSLVRMTTRLVEVMTEAKRKTSKVDKRPTERRIALLLRWLQQIFDRLVYTDYVESDTELCLRCLELISMYFEVDLGTRLLATGGKQASEVDSMMINITAWFLAVFPPAFSPVEDARRLSRYLRTSNARPTIFTPLVTRFFGSISDDEVPWEMLSQLHSFASALNSNELYELELSMVRQIQGEFQSVFGVTLAYEPEYEQIMRDLQDSIKNAEAAIAAVGQRNAGASSGRLGSPSVTPLVHRRRYLPPSRYSFRSSKRAHDRNSSPSPYHPRPRSQSPPPSSPIFSGSKSCIAVPPTPNGQQKIPPPQFSSPSPPPPASHTPLLKKRKRMIVFVELTPWIVKKRRMLAQGDLHTPKNLRASFEDQVHSPALDTRNRDSRTSTLLYPPDRPVRVVDKERYSSADTASSCSPTSSRTRLIASRRFNCAPSPSPVPDDDRDIQVPETSEESGDSEVEERESDDEEDEDDPTEMSIPPPTSDDPLNLFALPDSSPRVRPVYNAKPRPKPLPHSRLTYSP